MADEVSLFPAPKPAAYVVLGVVKRDGDVDRWQLRQQRVRHCIANSGDLGRVRTLMGQLNARRFGRGHT